MKAWSSTSIGSVLRIWTSPASTTAYIELNTDFLDHAEIRIIAMWSSLRPIQLQALSRGGGPFHSLLAEYDGRGILIAGPAESGKSTCHQRLPTPWNPLCDDHVLVVKRDHSDYAAHPFPTWSEYLWKESDKTWPTSYTVPINAIFFLEQADVDHVTRVIPEQAAPMLFESQKQVWQRHWARIDPSPCDKQRIMAFENACALARAIPTYVLKATLLGRFWGKIEEVM